MSTVSPMPIDPELAKRLRTVRKKIDKSLEERDRLIAEAIGAGGSLREVGQLIGLSHTRVRQIAEGQSSE